MEKNDRQKGAPDENGESTVAKGPSDIEDVPDPEEDDLDGLDGMTGPPSSFTPISYSSSC